MLSRFLRDVFVDYNNHNHNSSIREQLNLLQDHISVLMTKKSKNLARLDMRHNNARTRSRSNNTTRSVERKPVNKGGAMRTALATIQSSANTKPMAAASYRANANHSTLDPAKNEHIQSTLQTTTL
jgi:hypothetical protein